MERTVVTPGKARDLDITMTPGERGVVGGLEGGSSVEFVGELWLG